MKIFAKVPEEPKSKITKEMKDWFVARTKKHILIVGEFCEKISKKFPEFEELIERAKVHDDSKFEEPELSPYVWITWKYKCKEDGKDFDSYSPPADIEKAMLLATEHHVLNNSHHPEFHCGKKSGVINKSNRDKPLVEDIIDATSMPDLDIAEMCADWCSVSTEKGNKPQKWAKDNINVRWKFSEKQEALIWRILDIVFPE